MQASIKAKETHTIHICNHCGDDCRDELIQIEDKNFCCEGCKMVYEILNDNDLCRFYDMDEKAGVRVKAPSDSSKFDYLDNEQIFRQLIDYEDDNMVKITFYLPQIHCSACIWLLENLYKLNDALLQSKVNFLKKEAYITFQKEKTSLKKVVALLASIGYEPEINLNDLSKTKSAANKKFYYQLGVAGFAFGNIMLMSFPEYLGLSKSLESGFYQFFGYLNLALILPVVVYSAQHYFQSAWAGIRQRNLNIDVPIVIGILTLFGRSTFEILTSTGAGYLDSLAGLIFFLLIGKWFQQKTYHQITFDRDYKSYFPISANRKKGQFIENIALTELKKNDIIIIKNNELIPADSLLLKGKAHIDYSFVTGESRPISRKTGEHIYAGGRQKGNAIEVQITKSVAQSYLTQLWNNEAFTKSNANGFTQLTNVISKYFTFIILAIATITGVYWWIVDATIAMNAFTAVLIIACPCAIALSVPFTLGNALRVLAKQRFFVKNTDVIERMAQVQHIIFDKTGTMTKANESQVNYFGKDLSDNEQQLITAVAQQSFHPVSQQIIRYFNSNKSNLFKVENFNEITGKGVTANIYGNFIQIGSHQLFEEHLLPKGTYIAVNGQIKGYFTIRNKPRKGLSQLIQALKRTNRLYLLSGDNEHEKNYFKNILPVGSTLQFEQSPEDKLNFIQNLQNQFPEQRVMMLGDGLNDAGALQQSDVGIAVSENTQHFSPACDAILDAQQFPNLHHFIQFSKSSLQMVRYALVISLLYNSIGLFFAVQGLLSPVIAAILMPLSSISVVIFGIISTNWLAKRLFS